MGETGLGEGKKVEKEEGKGNEESKAGVAVGKKGKGEELETWEGTSQRTREEK